MENPRPFESVEHALELSRRIRSKATFREVLHTPSNSAEKPPMVRISTAKIEKLTSFKNALRRRGVLMARNKEELGIIYLHPSLTKRMTEKTKASILQGFNFLGEAMIKAHEEPASGASVLKRKKIEPTPPLPGTFGELFQKKYPNKVKPAPSRDPTRAYGKRAIGTPKNTDKETPQTPRRGYTDS